MQDSHPGAAVLCNAQFILKLDGGGGAT